MLVNHSQPLLFWQLSRTSLKPKNEEAKVLADVLAGIYAAMILPYTVQEASRSSPLVQVSSRGLIWEWNYGKMAGPSYGMFILSACATAEAYYANPIPIQTAIIASFVLSWHRYGTTQMMGSMWCFYAAFLPWLLLLNP